ncbi:hypothetical protein GCM10008915_45330 [Bifidobacterium pullorum subsp. gallinarum]
MKKTIVEVMPEALVDWFMVDQILEKIRNISKDCRVILDFWYVYDFHPKGVIMLLTICSSITRLTNSKIVIINIHSTVFAYLEKINFLDHGLFDVDHESMIWDDNIESEFYESIIKITLIKSSDEKSSFVLDVKKMLEIWFPEERYRALKADTLSSLMELCGNSMEHSDQIQSNGSCYVIMQKRLISDQIEVSLITTDFGVGIKYHQEQKYGILYESDYKYINEALEGVSGRLDGTGGLGLQRIRNSIKEHLGELIIRSGKGTVSITNESKKEEGRFQTPGTQCAIILRKQIN